MISQFSCKSINCAIAIESTNGRLILGASVCRLCNNIQYTNEGVIACFNKDGSFCTENMAHLFNILPNYLHVAAPL